MIEESQSLKDKRSILRRIKDRVNQKYNCAIAEVGDPDAWQSAQLGFAVVSNERGFTQSMVQKILQFIDDLAVAKLIDDEQDYIDYGDGTLEGSSSGTYTHWEPPEPAPPKSRATLRPPKAPELEEVAEYPWDSAAASLTPTPASAATTPTTAGEPSSNPDRSGETGGER